MDQQLTIIFKNQCYTKKPKSNRLLKDSKFSSDKRELVAAIKDHNVVTQDTAIVLLIAGYTDTSTNSLVSFMRNNKVKNVLFFVEDVFRIFYENSAPLDTYFLDYASSYTIPELELIKNTVKLGKIKEYQVFHCEYNSKCISDYYQLDLKYFDPYLVGCIDRVKNDVLPLYKEIQPQFDYKVSCFNRRLEVHRFFIGVLLSTESSALITLNQNMEKHDVINNNAISFQRLDSKIQKRILKGLEKLDFNKLVIDAPVDAAKNNDTYRLCQVNQQDIVNLIPKSFVHVVTETRYASPMVYISEKTINPIAVLRPFIILGAPKTLALLKKLGFKTFDEYWSEEYDNILDHTERFNEVYKITKSILNKSEEQLREMLVDMEEILLYNQSHLKENFSKILFDLNNQ